MTTFGMIDEIISTSSPTSAEVNGAELARSGGRAQTTQISVQVIPVTEGGRFEVHLEGSINTLSGKVWSRIGQFDSGDEVLLSVFPISQNVNYRLRHVSGVDCRVLLTG